MRGARRANRRRHAGAGIFVLLPGLQQTNTHDPEKVAAGFRIKTMRN
jgi:hypothetical protein